MTKKLRVVFIGRGEWLFETIACVKDLVEVVAIVSSKEAPEYKVLLSDFEKVASELNVPFFESKFGNNDDLISFLGSLGNLDLGISVNHPSIISNEVLEIFQISVLNAHGGDLPRYRGNACQAWAILNGEEKIGLCIHKMIGGELDSGDIVERSYFPVSQKTKIGEVYKWMESKTPKLFLGSIMKLEKDHNYILEHQNKDNALRCFPRKPEDAKISWEKSAEEIVRLINASGYPYDGAYSYYKKSKVIISDAIKLDVDYDFLAVPGQICEIKKDYFLVSCKDAMIKVLSFKVIGADIINSIRERLK